MPRRAAQAFAARSPQTRHSPHLACPACTMVHETCAAPPARARPGTSQRAATPTRAKAQRLRSSQFLLSQSGTALTPPARVKQQWDDLQMSLPREYLALGVPCWRIVRAALFVPTFRKRTCTQCCKLSADIPASVDPHLTTQNHQSLNIVRLCTVRAHSCTGWVFLAPLCTTSYR